MALNTVWGLTVCSLMELFFFFFLVFIYLAAPGFCRGIRALVPSLGMEPGPLAPGVLIPGPPGKSCFLIF